MNKAPHSHVKIFDTCHSPHGGYNISFVYLFISLLQPLGLGQGNASHETRIHTERDTNVLSFTLGYPQGQIRVTDPPTVPSCFTEVGGNRRTWMRPEQKQRECEKLQTDSKQSSAPEAENYRRYPLYPDHYLI